MKNTVRGREGRCLWPGNRNRIVPAGSATVITGQLRFFFFAFGESHVTITSAREYHSRVFRTTATRIPLSVRKSSNSARFDTILTKSSKKNKQTRPFQHSRPGETVNMHL